MIRFLIAIVILALAPPLLAQQRAEPNPVEIADQIFNQFVPMATAEDEQVLAEIDIEPADERRFGSEMVKAFLAEMKRQKIKVRQSGKDVDYLRQLVETVRPLMTNAERYSKIDVYLVESDIPDARSVPGGSLFFFKGILELAPSEAAMIGVVGHELAHLDRGHQLVPLKQMRLMERSFASATPRFDPGQFFENGTRIARLMSRPFRPQDEAAADEDAVAWSHAAGYDAREFSKLLVRMHERMQAKNKMPVPSFLRTHPPTLERADATLAQFDRINDPPRKDLYIGTKNLQRRILRAEKEFAE